MPLTVLQRVARGDSNAIDDCLFKYGGIVWSLARRFCPRHEDAEDAVQEVFIELWRKAAKFDPEISSESTYVAMIARRRLIDRFRTNLRQPSTTALSDGLLASESEHESRTDVRDEAAHARHYVLRLRPEERRILELSVDQGLSQSQIAKATNMPLGTVKTHARRGLLRLRSLLREYSMDDLPGGKP